MTYPASLDKTNKISTVAVIILLLVVFGNVLYVVLTEPFPNEARTLTYVGLALTLVVIAISYGFRALSYTLNDDSLIINRPFGTVNYSIAEISAIQQLPAGIWNGGIRLFGVGGFFGFYGKFWSPTHGTYTGYGTRLDNKIFITFNDGRKILITPDSLELLDNLKRKTGK